MKKFLSNINTVVTLWDGKESKEVIVTKGKEIELPEDNNFVQGLIAQGHLTAVDKADKKTDK